MITKVFLFMSGGGNRGTQDGARSQEVGRKRRLGKRRFGRFPISPVPENSQTLSRVDLEGDIGLSSNLTRQASVENLNATPRSSPDLVLSTTSEVFRSGASRGLFGRGSNPESVGRELPEIPSKKRLKSRGSNAQALEAQKDPKEEAQGTENDRSRTRTLNKQKTQAPMVKSSGCFGWCF